MSNRKKKFVPKGYHLSNGYFGCIGYSKNYPNKECYQMFPTEEEYNNYIKEKIKEEESNGSSKEV